MLEKDPSMDNTLFDTSDKNSNNIYRFETNEKTKDGAIVTKTDYQAFFSQFSLYTGQKSFKDFKNEIISILGYENVVLKYMDLFKKWHLGEFTNKVIDKVTINAHLTDIWLSSFVISSRCLSSGQDSNLELFERSVKQFDITIIDELKVNFINELVEDKILENFKKSLPGHIQKCLEYYMRKYEMEPRELADKPNEVMTTCMLRLAKDTKFVDKFTSELKLDIKLKILYYFFEKPLIIEFNEISKNLIYQAMKLLKINENKIKLVFLGQEIDISKFSDFKTFQNLQDLSRFNNDLYRDFIRKCNLSIQGRNKVSLKKLIESYEEIGDDIGTRHLYKMLKGDYAIGGEKQILPDYYVPRTVSPLLLNAEVALNHFNKIMDLVLINSNGKFECIEDLLRCRRLRIIKVNDYLKQTQKYNKSRNLILIFATDKECSKTAFNKICQYNMNRNVHLFKIVDEKTFMLITSSSNVLEYTKTIQKSYVHENDIHLYFNGLVNVLCAQAGMGKSTMIKFLRNTCSSDYWTIAVDLKAHNDFFKRKHNCNEIFAYFLKLDKDLFLENTKQAFLKRKKIVIFFDGLDELERDCAEYVLDCVKELSKMGYHVWLSSRQNLQDLLESYLNLFTIYIIELSETQQVEYIDKRLQSKYEQDEIQEIVKNISDNTEIANNRQILGVPLQLFIITQIFLDDRQQYQNLNDNIFILTTMFKIFFEGRYKFSIDKLECKNPQLILGTMEDQLQKYEIPALQSLFDDNTFKKLNLDLRASRRFLEDIKTDKDPLGIIIKLNDENKAIFEHYSYAEYFGSLYLSNNFDKIQMLKEVLFSEKYQNLMLILAIMLAEECPLHLAVIYKNTIQIEKHLAHIYMKDKGGRNPLHLASCNSTKYVSLKKKFSGSRSIVYDYNQYSIERETSVNKKIIGYLLEIDPFEEDSLFELNSVTYSLTAQCLYPIEAFLEKNGHSKKINVILEKYYDDATIAYYSSRFAFRNLLSAVLVKKNSLVINVINWHGNSLLHFSVTHGYFDLTLEEYPIDIKIINLLIDNGIDVNSRNNEGYTALHWTAQRGHFDSVKLLVERGAIVNVISNYGYTVLHLAAYSGNIKIINLLLSKGVNINAIDESGRSALFFAVEKGCFEVAQLLLKNGANANLVTTWGQSVLHNAVSQKEDIRFIDLPLTKGADMKKKNKSGGFRYMNAAEKENFDIINLLLNNGANVNAIDNRGQTTLHLGAQIGNIKLIDFLLKAGAKINVRNVTGETPLHLAARNGHFDIVRILVERDADVNAVTNNGTTILHHAAEEGNLKVVDLLLNKGANVNALKGTLTLSKTALYYCIINGHHEVVDLLLKKGANINLHINNESPLNHAVIKGNCKIIELLLNHGAKINERSKNSGNTALFLAAQHGHLNAVNLLLEKGANLNDLNNYSHETVLHEAASGGNTKIIDLLLSNGADINAKNKYGLTPLNKAINRTKFDAVNLLLERAADCNTITASGRTTLYYAAFTGSMKLVDLLLSNGVQVDAKDKSGATALYVAVCRQHFDVANLLLKKGAHVNAITCETGPMLHSALNVGNINFSEFLLSKGVNVDAKNASGYSALHMAVSKGRLDAVNLLVKNKANINAIGDKGNSTLHYAVEKNYLKIINLLLEKDVNLNVKNSDGESTLHLAVEQDNLKVVDLLLKKGAALNIKNAEGNSALHLAVERRYVKIIHFLLENGIDLNIKNIDGRSAFHLAAKKSNVKIINLLLEKGADLNIKDRYGNNALHLAVKRSHVKIINLLLEKRIDLNVKNTDGNSALYLAALEGNFNIVNLLLNKGADVNVKNEKERTILETVINNRNTPISYSIKSDAGLIKTVELLLNKGVDINATNVNKENALHLAISKSFFDVINLLLEKGADFNAISNYGTTLHYAARNSDTKIMDLLLSKGFDVNADLLTAILENQFNAVKLLLEKKANTNTQTIDEMTVLRYAVFHSDILNLLLNEGVDVNVKNKNGKSVLHFAVEIRDLDAVHLLLKKGADITVITNNQWTSLLHYAVWRNNIKLVDLLLSKGIDVNASNNEGKTALHFAAEDGNLNSAQLLVAKGASVDAVTNDNLNALHFAVYIGKIEMVNLLLTNRIDLSRIDVNNQKYPLYFAMKDGRLKADLLIKITNVIQKQLNHRYDSNERIINYLKYHQWKS